MPCFERFSLSNDPSTLMSIVLSDNYHPLSFFIHHHLPALTFPFPCTELHVVSQLHYATPTSFSLFLFLVLAARRLFPSGLFFIQPIFQSCALFSSRYELEPGRLSMFPSLDDTRYSALYRTERLKRTFLYLRLHIFSIFSLLHDLEDGLI